MGPLVTYRHLPSHSSLPTSELRRITHPSPENVKLQMPIGITVFLAELNVQSHHMFMMNLKLQHAHRHSTGRAK